MLCEQLFSFSFAILIHFSPVVSATSTWLDIDNGAAFQHLDFGAEVWQGVHAHSGKGALGVTVGMNGAGLVSIEPRDGMS